MPSLTFTVRDGTVVIELTDEEVETLFECWQRNLRADLHVWEPVFVFWLSAFARWWVGSSTDMQKYWLEILAKVTITATLASALTKMIIRIIKIAIGPAELAKIAAAETRVTRAAFLAVGVFLAGFAVGTAVDALIECWRQHFPDKAIAIF
jgi:hypothetical protein